MEKKSILRFENVTVKYDKHEVLKDFSCDVFGGEFVSMIGPNGSGKSTLINAVMGSVELSGGKIYLGNKNNEDYTAKERARFAAVVPQNFNTAFGFKVRDIVMMGRNPYLKRMQTETIEDIRIVDEALKLTNTLHLKDRKITSLSGGERQRVIIAGALAQKPKLLILDEPTNHLDIHHNLEIMQLIKELNIKDGITVFAVLHDINMAARFSDRIILLDAGKEIKSGTVREVISEEVLKPVYQIDMIVRNNRLTDSPEIVPLRMNRQEDPVSNGLKVHVICGGGSGEMILQQLKGKGYAVSCGVLNIGDSDYEICGSLDIPVAMEAPYHPIGKQAYDENSAMIRACDIVILTDVAIGSGNLLNVEILKEAEDKKIYIISAQDRDYTQGQADKIIRYLTENEIASLETRGSLLEKIVDTRL